MLKDIATLSEFIILYSLKMTLFFRVSLRVILLTLSKEAGLIEKNILHDNQPSCCNKLGKKGQLNDPQVLSTYLSEIYFFQRESLKQHLL